jgi:hypothetical protein
MSETASTAAPEMVAAKPGIFRRLQNGLAFIFASKIAVVATGTGLESPQSRPFKGAYPGNR